MKRVPAYQTALLFFLTGTCLAAISDDFNSYSAPQLPATSMGHWRVYDGAVDLVGDGTGYQYFPFPGQGYYIDLVGTGSTPGILWSPSLFLQPGQYDIQISYKLGNFQPNSPTPDEVAVVATIRSSLFDPPGPLPSDPSAVIDLWTNPVLPIQAFTTYQDSTNLETNFDMYLHIGFYLKSTPAGDIGPLLDDVNIQANMIPAPGALLLGCIGIGCVNWFGKRKRL